jgi:uncharacterized membrane protein YbhN (UPF0104 family)
VLKKRLILAFKVLIPLIVFIGVGLALYKSWGQIQEVHWKPNYLLLVLAGICYGIAYIPAAVFWRYALRTLGQNPGVYESFRAYYIGHLGKYVPGKGFVIIIRSGLLNHAKTKISAAVAAVFVETMTMMAVGAFVATLIVVFWFRQDGHQTEHSNKIMMLAIGIMCGTMLPILPPIFHFAAKKCRIELEGLKFRTLAVGWLLNLPVWLMLGIFVWLTMQGIGMQGHAVVHDVMFCTLVVSMGTVFGFATLIPGGFGARELMMGVLLVPFFTAHPQTVGDIDPTAMAVAVSVVQRLLSIITELIIAAMLVWKR